MPNRLDKIAREIRKDVVRMHRKGSGVGTALSAVDILAALYFDAMNVRAADDPERDRFILSKGHGAAALYATLAHRGFFERRVLDTFLEDGSLLTGHPTAGQAPGIEVTTGSLGHGLPIAAGLALAAKSGGRRWRTFVLLGCGEMEEGSVWEGAMLASRLRLDNLVAIVDANNWQGYDRTEAMLPVGSIGPKFEAFGWAVRDVDGHDCAALSAALRAVPFTPGRPSALVARTVKGKGIAELEDRLESHYVNVPADKLQAYLDELDGKR